ncbi:Hsp33 family molecular chaperone HslO [Methylomonas koyamae]|uniref:Hsp33 family molecular chaperone HslO n=1 Tax=Methylomonas koyamae TaxID=702114 RepID=UPI000BC2DD57|nr:Hsp33 family molecular chaperone HslO [Methylomonas koyamae]ATG89070.1 molecular chaperone Hsp33 [Methylomonas koyamae]
MKQQDCLRRFIFEEHGVRGEWVRLRTSLAAAKQHQRIVDDAVDAQMGQALAAAVLLAATIKFKGAMIMQIQGGGELKALVAQASSDRKIRGLVRSADSVVGTNLREMIGEGGRLVLTVESENAEPYQGIVGVEADTLAEVLEVYFKQSEQLNTRLWLFADRDTAAGLLLQELPGEQKDPADWERLEMLAATVTAEEMFALDCEELLYRLFHQEKVRIFEAEAVEFKCNCSRQKIAGTLAALGRSELHAILQERDDIEVDCQFCGAQYRFDKIDVENLLANPAAETETNPPTRH